ncbi:hypothetical protein [Nocardia brasiliensis]
MRRRYNDFDHPWGRSPAALIAHLTEPDRFDLEQLLDFAIWLDHYNPHFT